MKMTGQPPIPVIVILLLALAFPTHAESPKETIFSDTVLRQAFSDIDSMEYTELSAFSRYLAECKDRLSDNEIIRHDCTVYRALYETEYSKDRSLDKLMHALFVAAGLLRSDKRNQHPDLVLRYADVEKQLAYIASIRFERLRDKARNSAPGGSNR